MERRNFFRWAIAARGFVPNWLLALIFKKRCIQTTYVSPETDGRAIRIGEACPACVCERVSVGRHGSPGKVQSIENLHSVVIAPTDLDKDALAITMITHAEKKGMSVLRQAASDSEFRATISARIKKANQKYHGVATFSCADVRSIVAHKDSDQRKRNDRLYYALDTDVHGLPHHAEIFATVPQPFKENTPKAAWRNERERLLNLLTAGFSAPSEFRGGTTIT
jgi:hypothetical protein